MGNERNGMVEARPEAGMGMTSESARRKREVDTRGNEKRVERSVFKTHSRGVIRCHGPFTTIAHDRAECLEFGHAIAQTRKKD